MGNKTFIVVKSRAGKNLGKVGNWVKDLTEAESLEYIRTIVGNDIVNYRNSSKAFLADRTFTYTPTIPYLGVAELPVMFYNNVKWLPEIEDKDETSETEELDKLISEPV